MELTCPKCQGAMRSYERNSVTVDQCTECRGIFLDRGELDRLIDAENRWHGEPATPAPAPAASAGSSGAGASAGSGAGLGAVVSDVLRQAQSARSHSSGYGSHGSHGSKRKKSFLDEIFG